MFALILAFALAKPDPMSTPPSEPTLYGAPILSAGLRGTVHTAGPESAGLELRLDSVVFARARLSVGPSVTPTQLDLLSSVFDIEAQRPWWGYQSSIEAAWAPIPNLRIGGSLSDKLTMTRGRERRLQQPASTRGQTSVGPRVAVGLFDEVTSLHLASGYDVPVAVKRGRFEAITPDGQPPMTAAELGNAQYFFGLEGRARYLGWVGTTEVNVGRTRRSRALQDRLPPDAQGPVWSDWQPSVSVGISHLF